MIVHKFVEVLWVQNLSLPPPLSLSLSLTFCLPSPGIHTPEPLPPSPPLPPTTIRHTIHAQSSQPHTGRSARPSDEMLPSLRPETSKPSSGEPRRYGELDGPLPIPHCHPPPTNDICLQKAPSLPLPTSALTCFTTYSGKHL